MNGGPLHVVLGASGGTGSALVRELDTRGCRVRAVSRSGSQSSPATEWLATDVASAEAARAAVAEATVVYHAVQPPYPRWAEDFPPLTATVAEATAQAGAKLVFADNLYMYGPGEQRMGEETPLRGEATKKGRVRIEMAERLLSLHREGRLAVAIGRSSDYYGPNGSGSAVGRLVEASVQGKKTSWLGSLDQPHTLSYLEDMARGLAVLGEREEAGGEVWHLPAAEPLTGREFVGLLWREVGAEPRIGRVSRPMIRFAGLFSPFLRELAEVMYQWEEPFISDATKFQRRLGPLEPPPHVEALARTVAWYRDRR